VTAATPEALTPVHAEPRRARPVEVWYVGALLVAIALVLLAPFVAGDPFRQDLSRLLAPPAFAGGSGDHLLGTDNLGRDVLARLLVGARYSFALSAAAVAVAALLGLLAASLAGFFRGFVERLLKLGLDITVGLPPVVLAIAVIAAVGPKLWVIALVLAVTGWPTFARVLYSAVLSLREREFVAAADAMGASAPYMVARVLVPNVLGLTVALSISMFGRIVGIEAALSFIGLGVQAPDPSWGNMLADSRLYLAQDPWFALAPGIALAATVLATTFVGTRLTGRGAARRVI
jgi:peptide/nickel transport system permease protein